MWYVESNWQQLHKYRLNIFSSSKLHFRNTTKNSSLLLTFLLFVFRAFYRSEFCVIVIYLTFLVLYIYNMHDGFHILFPPLVLLCKYTQLFIYMLVFIRYVFYTSILNAKYDYLHFCCCFLCHFYLNLLL